MRLVKRTLIHWIPLVVVVTLASSGIYGAVQQALRISANDPQIQMAEDAATALGGGRPVEAVVPADKIDIASSLAPYLVVFDDSGRPVASSGMLHSQMPALGPGVFDYVRRNGENRITWQPEPGVRSATVITRVGGANPGFVMAGRSLREVESRIDNIGLLLAAGWLGTCVAVLVAVAAVEFVFGRLSSPQNANGLTCRKDHGAFLGDATWEM